MGGASEPIDGVDARHPSEVLQDRLIDFAVATIKIAGQLRRNPDGKHVAGQLLRSGTSPAPNYAEARAAESSDDFIHKLKIVLLKIVLKELNETLVWFRIAQKGNMVQADEIGQVMKECDQLCRIVAASINTARRRRDGK